SPAPPSFGAARIWSASLANTCGIGAPWASRSDTGLVALSVRSASTRARIALPTATLAYPSASSGVPPNPRWPGWANHDAWGRRAPAAIAELRLEHQRDRDPPDAGDLFHDRRLGLVGFHPEGDQAEVLQIGVQGVEPGDGRQGPPAADRELDGQDRPAGPL